ALPGSYTAYVPIAGSAGPIAISPDGRTAYVGNRLIGQVVPVDLPSGRAQRPITLGDWPINAIAITPDGRTAYVVEGGIADAVIPIDLATRTVGPAIDVPGPRGLGTSIAMAPNGRMAYVDSLSESDDRPTSRQTVTITHTVPSYVVPIDLVTDKALRPISLEPLSSGGHTVLSEEPRCVTECGFGETIGGIAITADGRTAYVSDSAYGSNSETKTTSGLFSIELSTEQVSPEIVTTGAGGPLAITPDGQFAYVASDYTVTSIDLGSNTAGPSLSVVPPGEMLSAMAITPDGATLIAAGYSEIGLINLHSGKVESLIQSPGGAVAIAPTP
ncbi:MAG TPA: YncE family protein, partial [Acidimicrobiales bacterium]|nr:YncE family protein [Acidimicrobiales bacterium]